MVVLSVWKSFTNWFWNPDIWLPPGVEWDDLIPNERVKYTDCGDLFYPIPLALLLLVVRFIVERLVLYPFGRAVGLKSTHRIGSPIVPNKHLEEAYRSKLLQKFNYKELEALAKKTDLEVRQVERWMRKRNVMDKPTTLAKFSESGWRCIMYCISCIYGIHILWGKQWAWDINLCWYDYPHHSVLDDIWWYYAFGSSFYWSLLFSQFFDVKRKDFWQMFVHHLTTIALLGFSWVCNLTKVGALVLLLHDCADSFLEAAKMLKYAKSELLGNIVFVVFTVIWIVTRLVIYPVYILNSTLFEAPQVVPMFPAYYIFNSMLSLLLFLHIFWTYFIFKVIFKALNSGTIEDTRSSSESSFDEDYEHYNSSNSNHVPSQPLKSS